MLGCVSGTNMRHRLTLVSGFVESLCFSGIAYGWASLVFILKADGYFGDFCVDVVGLNTTVHDTDCSGQDAQFSLVFTVASFSTNIIRFPLGLLFDHFGTMVTRLLTISLYTSGTLLIALLRADLSALLFPAVSCLMTSGMLFYTTNAQVGNLFYSHRSTVITVYSGAFDSSAAVFLIVKLLHEQGVSLHSSFLALSACSILHLFRTFFLMPKGHIPYPLPEGYTYGVSCRRQPKKGRNEGAEKGEENSKYQKNAEASMQGELLHPRPEPGEVASFRSCVLSWFFLWHFVWVAVMQFCHFLFIATVNPMLNRLANRDQSLVSQYTNAFAFTQLFGVLCAPWNGLILDRHKRKPLAPGETMQEADLHSTSLSLFLTSLQCFFFAVCFSTPLLPLQYVTFVLQVVNSAFIYGGHQAFISIAFPSCHFGKLSGLITSLSAMMLLLQFPVLYLIKEYLHGDPLYVNVGVTLLSFLTFIHPLHVFLHCRRLANQRRAKLDMTNKRIMDISKVWTLEV